MKDPRNPFRLRAAEEIDNDSTFIRFFEPSMLDLLPVEDVNAKVHIIRSAAGGGKTTLLRLFTPGSLLALYAARGRDECKELYARVREMGFIDETGPHLLAVNISFSQEYADLTDMGVDNTRMVQLFFALLNARIVLATLRGATQLARLQYPMDLAQFSVSADSAIVDSLGLQLPCTGDALYEWAKRLESDVCEALAGFDTHVRSGLGHRSLLALGLIQPGALTIGGVPVARHALVTFDNGQDIAPKQREALLQHLLSLRSPVGVWLAERFEAMSTDELLSSGALAGRDYHAIMLERFWREPTKRAKFQRVLFNIADRRSRDATADVNSFASCLEPSMDGTREQRVVASAFNVVSERVRSLTKNFHTYDQWIAERDSMQATTWEKLVAWRRMEILIERDRRKTQRTLDFDLSTEELKDQDGSDIQSAARMFLAKEFKLPYYYGPDCLASLSSSNIQQFLWLAGNLFEEVAAADVLKNQLQLSPTRQDAIIRASVSAWWSAIPLRMRNGREVMKLLSAIGEFAKDVSYQPNAPYSPGVTGIAISMAEFEQLRKEAGTTNAQVDLRRVLSRAIAHNLLEAIPDYSVKNSKWLVLYLNRALCVQFGLPWQYGGFREKKVSELRQWMLIGYKSAKGQLL